MIASNVSLNTWIQPNAARLQPRRGLQRALERVARPHGSGQRLTRAKRLLSCIGQDRANDSSQLRGRSHVSRFSAGRRLQVDPGQTRVARKPSRDARRRSHPCATTTPRVRRAIQASEETNIVLAKRHGVNRKTIAKWKAREFISDERMGPKNPRSSLLTQNEEVDDSRLPVAHPPRAR